MLLTFDVEPFWADIPTQHDRTCWQDYTDQSASHTIKFLEFCIQKKLGCSFFIVGAWAERNEKVVRRISDAGYSIGSHSMWHEDMALKDRSSFIADVLQSKTILENIIGKEVNSFRAPSFSLRPWQLDLLPDIGIQHDSSITHSQRIHGGNIREFKPTENLTEHPFKGLRVLNSELTILGGGYLRLIPPSLIKLSSRVNFGNMIYLHPHDLPTHLNLSRFKHMTRANKFRKTIRNGSMYEKLLTLDKIQKLKGLPDVS